MRRSIARLLRRIAGRIDPITVRPRTLVLELDGREIARRIFGER